MGLARGDPIGPGVPQDDLNTTLGANLGGTYVNDFNRFGRIHKVYSQAEPEVRASPDQLSQFKVRNRDGGMVPLDTLATLEAAKSRFRPVLMTALSFVFGVLPLLVATGAGAEARKVMGMAVFSGMLVATMLGVFFVPLLHVVVASLRGSPSRETPAIPATPDGEGS